MTYKFKVISPSQMSKWVSAILADVAQNPTRLDQVHKITEAMLVFEQEWSACFERFGDAEAGELSYRDVMTKVDEQVGPLLRRHLAASPGQQVLRAMLSLLQDEGSIAEASTVQIGAVAKERRKIARRLLKEFMPPLFKRPLFIISAPRSGSTLLFESLAKFSEIWTVGEESHELIEGIPALHPAAHGYHSNRLTQSDATVAVQAALKDRFGRQLQRADGQNYIDLPTTEQPLNVRFLEKTPKNALRIPFLQAIFPDALFLVLYRTPEATLSSMLDGWRSRRFVAYRSLPNWPHRSWKFLLTPGWESLRFKPLVEIVAQQWRVTYETLLADLEHVPESNFMWLSYEALIHQPAKTMQKIAYFADLAWSREMAEEFSHQLPLSSMTFSAPERDKWHKNRSEIDRALPGLEGLIQQISKMV